MMKVSTDNSLIYTFLESTGQLPNDFTVDSTESFDHEDDFCLIIYSAFSRNFILFQAENYLQQTDALPSLLSSLQDYSGTSVSSHLIEEAIKLVENKMHSKNNSRFFFDAH